MKFRVIIILAIVYAAFTACGDVPVFTEMDTNRLTVRIKGTLESEGISNLTPMPGSGNAPLILSDSIVLGEFNETGSSLTQTSEIPTTFMFDIAELRLDGKKFGNYRQVLKASLSGDGSTVAFFNKDGVELDNDDPPEGDYDYVQLYVRKMVFDGGNIYRKPGSSFEWDKKADVIFNEVREPGGFDFNQLQQNTYVDSLRLNSRDYLRSFPINIPIIGGLQYDKSEKETVLEIRLVVKNFVKKYEFPFYEDGVFKVYHFYALSDWLRTVRPGDRVLGGNILAVARAYVPGKTGKVTVSATSGEYVIAIPSSENIGDYFKTTSASATRPFPCDLPQPPVSPGNHIEALLDYYIRFEDYKNKWNTAISTCNDFEAQYVPAWDTYDQAFENFKIPPYVGSSSAGSVTFSNMAPGEYKFYKVSKPTTYGKVFEGAPPSSIGTVTVTPGSSDNL